MTNAKFQLLPEHWYSWQMIPGYSGKLVPYCSPIWVKDVTPRKTGKGVLGLEFTNMFYAEGVQAFSLDLRVLKHEANYLVSEILYGEDGSSNRTAVVGPIGFDWIERFCPDMWSTHPPSSFGDVERGSVYHYLDAIFRRDA